jgi:pimeloyl-ACP methyl ester carboxylesterase
MQRNQKTIRLPNLELATESFGDPAHPAVLLAMGGMASMLWWPEAFCEKLAARGLHVIRFDQRDTGLSTQYPAGEPGYGFGDAAEDLTRILDGYGIAAAHLVGMSLGGVLAQAVAIKHPKRVLSLTVLSSQPLGEDTSALPKSGAAWLDHLKEDVDWSNRADAVRFVLEDARLIAGTAFPFDLAGTKTFLERDFDRSGGYLSGTNHSILFDRGNSWNDRLAELKAPLLVMHGSADPVFPVENGEMLAAKVRDARLIRLDGGGHEVHPGHWETIVGSIADHAQSVG